jgi:hypothetical protein
LAFLKLVVETGEFAFPKLDNEPIDPYLGRLEQKGLAVQERVKQRLSFPTRNRYCFLIEAHR